MAKDKANLSSKKGRSSLNKIKKKSPKKRKQYSSDNIRLALEAINKGMSKKLASKTYGIPRTTLIFHTNHPDKNERPGPPTVLTAKEEEDLVNWIKVNSRKGFPRRKEDLITSVAEFLKKANRPNPFKDGVPGGRWYNLFMKRHKDLATRTPESVTDASSCVSEDDIRRWFRDIHSYLEMNDYADILKDPSRILNGDETNFQLCPKSGRVLSIKGDKNVYEIDRGQAKSSLTVLFTFKANGEQTPPLVIYPNKRLPKEIATKVPKDWGIGLSENGWMKTDIFVDYIRNVLHPYLTRTATTFPVILFVDGHKTHVTLSVSELCSELQIVLIALYPNATRILQPADVSAFKPLKNGWKKSVMEWRRKNTSQALTKLEFAPILENAINSSIRPEILRNGFRATGLYPWNPDNINFDKCLGKRVKSNISNNKDIVLQKTQFLDMIKECEYEKDRILKEVFDFFRVSPSLLKSTPSETSNNRTIACTSKDITSVESEDDFNEIISAQPETKFDIANLPLILCDSVEDWHDSQEGLSCFEVSHEVQIHTSPVISNTLLQLTPNRSEVSHNNKNDLVENIDIFTDGSQQNIITLAHSPPKIMPTNLNDKIIRSKLTPKRTAEVSHINKDDLVENFDVVTDCSQENVITLAHSPPKIKSINLSDEIIRSMKKINLQDTLVLAKSPVRKGVRNTERISFVLTSEEWQKKEKSKAYEKQKKIEEVKKRKEDRILKKEETKKTKNLLSKKKTEIKKTGANKIIVMSDDIITQNKTTDTLETFNNPKTKSEQPKRIMMDANYDQHRFSTEFKTEEIAKVKIKLNFDDKKRTSASNKLLETPMKTVCTNVRLNIDSKDTGEKTLNQDNLCLTERFAKEYNVKPKLDKQTLQDEDIENLLEENSQ